MIQLKDVYLQFPKYEGLFYLIEKVDFDVITNFDVVPFEIVEYRFIEEEITPESIALRFEATSGNNKFYIIQEPWGDKSSKEDCYIFWKLTEAQKGYNNLLEKFKKSYEKKISKKRKEVSKLEKEINHLEKSKHNYFKFISKQKINLQ